MEKNEKKSRREDVKNRRRGEEKGTERRSRRRADVKGIRGER
jgi:hypothetical protein